ncbi:MAG: HAD-IC family P-type ATPase [Polyangiaceae bacterium]
MRFCCYGCELAARIQTEAREDHAGLLGTLSFTLVLSMIVMMLSLFLYAEDVFVDAAGDRELAWMRTGYRWASLCLATPVLVLAGGPLLRRALAELSAGRLSMDALIVSGASAAFALSTWHVLGDRGGIYLDSATAALVLATFGRYLEAVARSRASRALGPLLEVSRSSAYRLADDGSKRTVAAAEIAVGMRIEVPAEQVVPADLALDAEAAEVDLAVLTGESRPVVLARGDTVPAGAVAVGASIVGWALRPAHDSALERLATLARGLTARSSPTLRWADRFATVLVPAAGLLAAATFVYWSLSATLEKGVVTALAVVLVACPCSYAIASPLVHWITLRTAFARGVLVRSPDVLEALAHARTVAFDKTGTLSGTELAVTSEFLAPGMGREEIMGLVCSLEGDATHPIARALRRVAGDATPAPLTSRRYVPGSGALGTDRGGRALVLGRGPEGTIVLERDGAELARFELAETLRPEAPAAVDELRRQGLRVVILSGDAPDRVARAAEALRVDGSAGLGPTDKLASLRALGDHVVMVGDGLNDVPALAGRATSFTLGEAAPLAKGVAQVTLLEPDLRLVPWTIAKARHAVRLVKWLIAGSTVYNVVFVALAASGALIPVFAGLSMLLSSLIALAFAVGVGTDPRADDAAAGLGLEAAAPC